MCLETDFHAIIFSLQCQIQEHTCQVEVVKATAQKFLTWREGNMFCMLVHGSLPSATNSTENYHPQQSTNQRVKANKVSPRSLWFHHFNKKMREKKAMCFS